MLQILYALLVVAAGAIGAFTHLPLLVLGILTFPALMYMCFCRWSVARPKNVVLGLMTLSSMHIAAATGVSIVSGDTALAILFGLFTLAWAYKTLGIVGNMASLRDSSPHVLAKPHKAD